VVKTRDYQSYLLRFWRVGEDGPHWRAMLEDCSTGKRVGFARLDDVFDYLRGRLGVSSAAEEGGTSAGTDNPLGAAGGSRGSADRNP
jgi:hypothetical protein